LSDIRVTYSGLIGFVVGLISVFTGLVFIIIVTRRLSPEEFGTWALIGNMVFYFLLSEVIMSYWSVRQVSRGENVGKTAILSSSSISLASIPIYLVFAFVISEQANVDFNLMILGAILIPVQFVSQTLASINLGHKPHARSYGLLTFEALKIPVGLALVYFLDLGVTGAIITVFLAYVGRIIIQSFFARQKLKGKFSFSTLKRWIKLSWIPLYSYLTNSIWAIDVVLYSLITGSVIGVAYYSVSLAVAGILKHSGFISLPLYPKLIAKGSFQYIQDNFSRQMYFAIPLLGIAIIFAKPALFALNPVYEATSIIVVILSFKTFFWVFRDTLDRILLGIDTIDLEENLSFSQLRKSKLFFVPTRKIIHFGLYISTLIVTLILLQQSDISEIELVQWWAIIGLSFELPFFLYLFIRVRRDTKLSLPILDITKYASATLAFVLLFFITSEHIITYQISIFQFLPTLILQLAICVGAYLLITYLIDKKTRTLFVTILNELRKKK